MPGYPKSMYAEPTPTEEVATVESRFSTPKLPQLTIVQIILVAVIVAYAWTSRKMNGMVVATLALTIGMLHMYDHLYRVKRGPERLFFLPQAKKEEYGCMGCK
jgi:hypothetical protein